MNAGEGAAAVFQVLNHSVDPGQVAMVKDALPEDVRRLWPDAGSATGRLESAA